MEDYQKTAAQMAADTRDKLIIDLRREEDSRRSPCPGAVSLWWETMARTIQEEGVEALHLPKDRPLYLLCYTGETSDESAQLLRGEGYDAWSVAQGYRGYLRHALGLDAPGT